MGAVKVGASSLVNVPDGTTTASATYPQAPTAGNLLIVSAAMRGFGGFGSASTPAGWTLINGNGASAGAETTNLYLFYKVAVGSDTAPSFTFSGTREVELLTEEWSGVNAVRVSAIAGNSASVPSTVFCPLSGLTVGDWIFSVISSRSSGAVVTWSNGATADTAPASSGAAEIVATGVGTATATTASPTITLNSGSNISGISMISTAFYYNPYANAVRADAPLAYWKVDEPSGSTFLDSSGNSRSLTVSGTPTMAAPPAKSLPGASLDLSAGNGGGYVSAPSYLTSITVFSIEFWAKWTNTADMILLARDNVAISPANPERVWTLNVGPAGAGVLYFEAYTTAGGSAAVTSTAALNDGTWHHVVTTVNGSALAMYVDGGLNSTATLPGTLNSGVDAGNGTWFSIGGGDNFAPLNYHPFSGGLDDVAVYGTSLTATQIQRHYAIGASSYRAAVLMDAPLIYLGLGDSGSTAFDLTAQAHNGTYVASPTHATGISNVAGDTATSFDGSATQYVSVAGASWQNVTNYSVEVWAKTTSNLTGSIGSRDDGDSNKIWDVQFASGAMQFVTFNAGGDGQSVISPLVINDGKWHHIVAVKSGTTMTLYVDGKASGTPTTWAVFTTSATQAINVGRRGNSSSYLGGSVDEFAFYGAALTAAQVATHYVLGANLSYGSAVLADSPQIYLKLDETSGSAIADSSGNGRPGVYNGAALGQPGLFPASSGSALGTTSGYGIGTVPDSAWMNNAVYSVELWVKPTNTGDIVGLAARFQGFAAGAWLFWQRSGELRFLVETAGAQFDLTGPVFNVGTVYYLVGTYDGTTQRLYVNGAPFSSQAVSGAGAGSFGQDVQLGGYSSSNLSSANLDDFAIYGTVLSPGAVLLHYTAAQAALSDPPGLPPVTSLHPARRVVLARASTR